MKNTKRTSSRLNATTNWERVKTFMPGFGGGIVMNEDHRIVCHALCEDCGLVLNLGQTSLQEKPSKQFVICPDCINRGVIHGNTLTTVGEDGEKTRLEFGRVVVAPIE